MSPDGSSPDAPVRLRVLVADDHLDHLEMISRAIRRSEHGPRIEVTAVEDGDAAYRTINEGVDIAFLDIKMPGRSGLEILEAIRKDPRHAKLPVVIVSSSSDPWDTEMSSRNGALAHIEKGRYHEFRDKIIEVLGQAVMLADRN